MRSGDRIDVAYSVHDHYGTYYEYLGTSMVSVMENTDAHLHFYILTDSTLKEKARADLSALAGHYECTLSFLDIVLPSSFPLKRLLESGYNEGIVYRLFLPTILPDVKRLIYLDSDIIVNMDIRELWNLDTGGYPVMGRWDPPLYGAREVRREEEEKCRKFWDEIDWDEYINSGVLIMNLDIIRKGNNLLEEAEAFWKEWGMSYPDQDAINFIFKGCKGLFSARFNMFNGSVNKVKKGIIYHFNRPPQTKDKPDEIDALFLFYWEKTPFFRPEWDDRDKLMFLRRMKSRIDVYERLRKMGDLSYSDIIAYAVGLENEERWEEEASILSSVNYESEKDKEYKRISHLVTSLSMLGRNEDGVEIIDKFLSSVESSGYFEHDERDMILRREAGIMCYKDGNFERAIFEFEKCLYYGTEYKNWNASSALKWLVKAAILNGDRKKAEKYYMMLYALMPEDESTILLKLKLKMLEEKDGERNEDIHVG